MNRLKFLVRLSPSASEKSMSPEDDVSFVPMKAIHDGPKGIDPSHRIPFQEAQSGSYTYFSSGDVLLAKVTPCFENGKKGLAEDLRNDVGYATSEVCVLRPNTSKIHPKFLIYLLSSEDFRSNAIASMTGVGGLKRISAEAVRDHPVTITDVCHQALIVQFLDRETTRIDGLVEKKGRFIKLLKEKRAALITHAVTKGIDENVDEGRGVTDILLSNPPATWRTYRVGQIFKERKLKVSDRDYPALSVTKQGIVPQLETAAKTDDGDNRKGVLAGDYVINSRSDRKGSSGLSMYRGSISLINIVLQPEKAIYPPFAHHLFRSNAFQEEFYRWGHGIVTDLWTTRYADMKGIRVALSDLDTQKTIADFLDRETTHIDGIIAKIHRSIELLKEKRSALITAAVTGQIDVTTWRKPGNFKRHHQHDNPQRPKRT